MKTLEVVFQLTLPTVLSTEATTDIRRLPLRLISADAGCRLPGSGFRVYAKLSRYCLPGVVFIFVEIIPGVFPWMSIHF